MVLQCKYNKYRNEYLTMIGGTIIVVLIGVLVNTKNTQGGTFVETCKFTEFGLCVKNKLLRKGKDQKWLEEEVTRRTGKFMDSGYMYKILTGQRNPGEIISAIMEVLDIETASS